MAITLAEAVQQVLDAKGTGLLRDSKRFASALLNVCEPDMVDATVLARCCDYELLQPFAQVARSADSDGQSLQYAALNVSDMLTQRYGILEDVSNQIAGQLMLGVGRHLGIIPPPRRIIPPPRSTVPPHDWVAVSAVEPPPDALPPSLPEPPPDPLPPSPPEPPEHPEEVTPNGSNNVPKKRGPLLAVAAVVLALVAFYAIASLVGYYSRCTATFTGGSEAQGTMTALEAGKGEEITLPECEFENEGFVFHDWEDVAGDHYAPGDTYSLESSTTFEATWAPASVTASFDGGGAEGGSTDAISCVRNEYIELPKCGFKRKFHRFSHWELDGSTYKPGDKLRLQEDVKLTAVWELDPSKCLTVTREFKARTSDDDFIVVLNVRNDYTQTLNVVAEFELFDGEKKSLGRRESVTSSVGPNETACLFTFGSNLDGENGRSAVDATYELRIDDHPLFGDETIASYVSVTETSCDNGKLVAEVKNKGDSDVFVFGVVAFSEMGTETFRFESKVVDIELAPGESKPVEFEGEEWRYFSTHEFYVYAFIW